MKKAANRKFKYFSLLLCLLLLMACKKESKEYTTVNFHLYNPASEEGFPGVRVAIIQQETTSDKWFKLDNNSKSKTIWEGITDASGKVSHSFKTYDNLKYQYWQTIDESFLNTKKILRQPDYKPLQKNAINKLDYTATIPASHILSVKNINCTGNQDKFRIKYKWLYNSYTTSWTSWFPVNNYIYGCYDAIQPAMESYNDYLIYQYEVERNGVLNIYQDTFYISPYSTDTLKILY